MSNLTLSDDTLAELKALAEMPDEDINVVAIPEAPVENWTTMRRPGLEAAAKAPMVKVDPTVAAWLCATDAHTFHVRVNRILTNHMLRRLRKQKRKLSATSLDM